MPIQRKILEILVLETRMAIGKKHISALIITFLVTQWINVTNCMGMYLDTSTKEREVPMQIKF